MSHLIGLRALQTLPFIALVLVPNRLSDSTRVRLALTAGSSYFALFMILLWQALRGQSVLAPDALTFVTLGAWATMTAAAARLSLVRRVSGHTPVAVSR